MPRKTNDAELDVEALVAEVAALKKEVAALKSAVSKRSSGGGSDSRVGKLVEAIKGYHPRWQKALEKAGL